MSKKYKPLDTSPISRIGPVTRIDFRNFHENHTSPFTMHQGILIYLTLLFLLGQSGIALSQERSPEFSSNLLMNSQVQEADSLLLVWEWASARPIFKGLAEKFKRAENWEGYIYCLNKEARALLGMKEYDKAYKALRRTLEEGAVLIPAAHAEMGRAHCYLGHYWTWGKQDSQKADSSFQRSLEIRQNTLPPDHPDLAEIHHELGRYYREVEQFEQSKYHHERAIEGYKSQPDTLSLLLARGYRYYGLTLRDAHYPTRAMNVRRASKRLYEAIPYSPLIEIAYINDNLGAANFDLQDYKQARGFYEMALDIKSELFGLDSPQRVVQLNNLGSCYGYLDELDKAIVLFEEALAINLNSAATNYDDLIISYDQYGDVFYHNGYLDEAIYYGEKALHTFNSSGNEAQFQKASITESLARYYLDKNEWDRSMTHIQTAIGALDTNLINLNFDLSIENFSNPFPDMVYKCLSTKALILTEIGFASNQPSALEESLQLYQFLELLSDKFRNALYAESSKLFLAQYYRANAAHALDLISSLQYHQPSDQYPELAFQLMEKNRYVKLYSDQSKARRATGTDIPDNLLEHESIMSSKMEGLRFELNYTTALPRRQELQAAIFALDNEYQAFQQRMSRDFPSYYSDTFRAMLSLSDVQEQLDRNTQVIEYFWSDTTIYSLSISRSRSELRTIPFSTEDQMQLKSFLEGLSRSKANDSTSVQVDRYANFEKTAYLLYTKLIAPITTQDSERLIISPDGILSLLPFEVLIVTPGQTDFRDARYLLHTRDINYAYSLNLLFDDVDNKRISASKPDILAMAFSDHEIMDTITLDQSSYRFPEIMGSSFECDIIADIFRSHDVSVFKGKRATEAVFKELAEEHEILHLAVHGQGDLENELNASLYFRDAPNTTEDGRLLAHELYGMELSDVQLAVLSACESGVGKEIEGEGVFSIARGFAQAGCPATMMSLWNVNDIQTSNITRLFYTNLRSGMDAHSALQKAKRSFIEEAYFSRSADPYYWAGFIHIGVSQPVTGPSPKWFLWIALVLLAAVLLWIRQKSKKHA